MRSVRKATLPLDARCRSEAAQAGSGARSARAEYTSCIVRERRTLDYARNIVLTDNDAQLVDFLREVEVHVAADGTVGAEDFATVLATRVLEPEADAVVASVFASLRVPLYIIVIAALAGPLAVLAGIRAYRRRRGATPS